MLSCWKGKAISEIKLELLSFLFYLHNILMLIHSSRSLWMCSKWHIWKKRTCFATFSIHMQIFIVCSAFVKSWCKVLGVYRESIFWSWIFLLVTVTYLLEVHFPNSISGSLFFASFVRREVKKREPWFEFVVKKAFN